MDTFNIFDASFTYDSTDPEGYRAGMARFGPLIGAARMGATVYELPPGQALCPYHYETDEEWVLVLAGELTVRVPEGSAVLRPGDVACFPSGPDGAHKTWNAGSETVRLLMLSTKDPVSVAVYPDSKKLGVWTGRHEEHVMVRLGDRLEYYEGEA